MFPAGRRPVSPGAHLLPVWVAAALLMHAAVLHIWSGPAPVFTRSDRSTPMRVRITSPEPIPGRAFAPVGLPPLQTDNRPAEPRPVAEGAVAIAPAASSAAGASTESPRGYDVSPVPERGWNVSFQAIDPSADFDTIAIVELEVSAQGLITRWRVVESNAPLEATVPLLLGVEKTPMLPAMRDGEPVDAIVQYELRFLRVPSN